MQKCPGSQQAAPEGFLKKGAKVPALCCFYFDVMVLAA